MAPTFKAIGLAVADMAAALAFYRRLGMDIPPEADKEPHVEVEVTGGFQLMFDTHESIRSFDPDFTPGTGWEGGGLAFRCTDPAEVDRVHSELVSAGHRSYKEPWDAFWGQRYAVLHDPDGNSVDLYAPLPT